MKVDFPRLLTDYSIPWQPPDGNKVMPGWIGIRCPLCNDNDFHGGFNLAGGYYNCWLCGGSSSSWVLSRLLYIGMKEAVSLLKEYSGGIYSPGDFSPRVKFGSAEKVVLPGSFLKPIHKKYLKDRNFDPEYLTHKYSILGTISGDYKYRVIIPIHDRAGRLISYQGRDVTGKAMKYKGARIEDSKVHYKHTLYPLNYCKGNSIIVVEGVFDAWRLGDGAVCTFGTSVTEFQIRVIASFDRIFVLFDAEIEAQEKARRIAVKLACLKKQVELVSLSSGDPAELSPEIARTLKKDLGVS